MTKTKTYHYGKTVGKSYCKPVGLGWEVSLHFNGKPLFVGNFVHAKEATQWFSFMNKEVTKFSRKYTTGYQFPLSWFGNFLKNHLYTQYYGWLDKVFTVHQKTYGKAFDRSFRQYKAQKKNYVVLSVSGVKKPFLKAA